MLARWPVNGIIHSFGPALPKTYTALTREETLTMLDEARDADAKSKELRRATTAF
jgi:hypothetical protein